MDQNTSANFSTTNTANNDTTLQFTWSFVPAMEAVIFPCVLIFNGSILALFLVTRRFQIPFNIYLINVITSNIVFALLDNPLDILNFISSYWWLGNTWCTVYLYAINVSSGIVMQSHMLITINRIWAVTFPHSYRRHHSVRNAAVLVIAVWLLVHVVSLPGLIMDATLYRLPIEITGCIINTNEMPVWSIMLQLIIFALPNLCIILAYPYLVSMRLRQRKVRAANRSPATTKFGGSVHFKANRYYHREASASASVTVTNNKAPERSQRRDNRAFAIFTALTVSITACWTPLDTYYTISCFMDLSTYVKTLEFCEILFVLQPALDPIFFAVIIPDVRSQILQWFRYRWASK
ncbi:alpha-2B adrenergic receptor-like [Paramacrobiotus metropolitanus]|uniref:alpha-2B adrenergic receptor-like n=1 Tax=Paramacrobiotus metropolitanus TaxID=2943436 RepID=UPI00244569B2|nr:alpha-2B adrenergic receptor-like [Paramacrobiotus metropolitanus]